MSAEQAEGPHSSEQLWYLHGFSLADTHSWSVDDVLITILEIWVQGGVEQLSFLPKMGSQRILDYITEYYIVIIIY